MYQLSVAPLKVTMPNDLGLAKFFGITQTKVGSLT